MQSRPNIGPYTLLVHMPEMVQRLQAAAQARKKALTMEGGTMRDNTHGVGTWTAAPAPAEGAAFANHTLRMIPRVSIGGSTLRVRISNAYGTRPLVIGAASVGLRSAGPAVVAGTSRRITFGGEAGTTSAVSALVVSDPVELTSPPMSDRPGTVHPLV